MTIQSTWHLDIWGFVVNPHFSDSVGTWFFAPGAIAFFNGLKNNQTLAQLVMELNPIGATGGWCDGTQRSIKRFFLFAVGFHVDTSFWPPLKKKNSPLGELCSICSWGWFEKVVNLLLTNLTPLQKKTSPFLKTGAGSPPTFALFPYLFPWGATALAEVLRQHPVLQFLDPWRVGGLGPGCTGSLPANVVGSINRTQAPKVSTKIWVGKSGWAGRTIDRFGDWWMHSSGRRLKKQPGSVGSWLCDLSGLRAVASRNKIREYPNLVWGGWWTCVVCASFWFVSRLVATSADRTQMVGFIVES